MRVFGNKQPEATDADRAAAARLTAVAARFKSEPSPTSHSERLEKADEPDAEA